MAEEQERKEEHDGLARIVILEKDFPITVNDLFSGENLTSKLWYAVYPGSEKLDIGDKKPVAFLQYESHAKDMIRKLWPGFGYYEPVRIAYSDK